MKNYLLLSAFAFCSVSAAATLTTENYIIEIERHCKEGSVTCDNVSYTGVSKMSGNSIELKGKTWHTHCADGVSPCRFLGYRFENGNVTYTVLESGVLRVVQGKGRVLIEETGAWSY
ncbi:hypothetical protein [Idiomarina aminovorans]|uniref:hypothetical protein n=1 Tax=Idiomarina aminovorans TaxID=2914829 RepID=UPI00200447C5|nr:hypothetical protein [Idiomarina sp. ATCH4]MCK7458291.1 hypothetical protein [Idiomarina sp. ATCH4]